MTLISKTAGALSLVSCAHDIHKTALISAKNAGAKANANSVISNSIRHQKMHYLSHKDAQRKNWLNGSNYFAGAKEVFAKIGGYIVGAAKASVRYIPNFICATIALCAGKNHNKIANIAAIGLGVIETTDFVVNSLGVGQRDDYLKIK